MRDQIATVLVVEDDSAYARLIELTLIDVGSKGVHRAADATVGLDMVRSQVFDLVICDLSLPGMDGVSFLKHLSALSKPPPVIILSGADKTLISAVEKLARSTGLVVLAALQKPPDLEGLKKLLGAIEYGPRPLSADLMMLQPVEQVSETLLADGLEQGWFSPFLEPKLGRIKGHVIGFELLARLTLPSGEVIGPKRFIQKLEDCCRIEQMTWQIAEKGFRFATECHRSGFPVSVSLNISPTMLGGQHLVERMVDSVGSQGLASGSVILEITESAAIDAGGLELENLARLRLHGFGLSIDDFGTGYSSLAQLSKVPFTEMKIDRMFSAAAPTDDKARAVATSCIELADRMGIKSCAEGVETSEIFRLLYDLGVDTFQGYLFHQPMPCNDFLAWAVEWNQRISIRDLYLDTAVQ